MLNLLANLTCFKRSHGALQNSYFMLYSFEVKQGSNRMIFTRIILVKILVGQQVFDFLSVYAPQCCLKDAVKDLFYGQLLITKEAVQAQVTKRYMGAEGMRGSWNMHWRMTCSVTCTPRNVTVTSLHTGQVMQTVLFHKSLC